MTTDTRKSPCCFRFQFLGEFRLESSLAVRDLHIAGKTQEVFAFLVLNANKTVRRATLSNLIWTDREERRSRANLNTALWRINRALNAVASADICLDVSGNQLKLTVAPGVSIDVVALEASVRDATTLSNGGKTALLSPAIRDTLIDILSGDCEGFLDGLVSEWVLIERERLFNLQ